MQSLIVSLILKSGLSVPYKDIASEKVIFLNAESIFISYASLKTNLTIASIFVLTISGLAFENSTSS